MSTLSKLKKILKEDRKANISIKHDTEVNEMIIEAIKEIDQLKGIISNQKESNEELHKDVNK